MDFFIANYKKEFVSNYSRTLTFNCMEIVKIFSSLRILTVSQP